MKIYPINKASRQGFTLIEMIGVLAVIAILAALLIPKIFDAISNARVNNAAVSYNSVKAALADHYAKYGSLLSLNGVAFATGSSSATNYDSAVLLAEGFLDKPFRVKIGSTNAHVEAVAGLAATTVATGINSAYDLDGLAAVPINDAGDVNSTIIQAVIPGVTSSDAKDLNDRLDGAALGEVSGVDIKGRVKYALAVGGLTDVYLYVSHR